MANGINLSGFREFEKKLKNLPARFEKEVNDVVRFAAATWEQGAKQAAPTDQGRIRNEIRSVNIASKEYQVVVNADHAAYLEWGTKTRVRVPSELQSYAAQFKGVGTGKDAKKFIYEWCKRKGIPPEAWYPIYRSIMVNGIKPQPFFFIQRPKVEKQFLQDLRQVLNKID